MASIARAFLALCFINAVELCSAFWRMNCGIIQNGRIDPIISPGKVSGHCHKLAGPSTISPTYDVEALTNAPCTSCEIGQDRSAYWTPQLYYEHANGSFEEVPNSGMVVYYLGRGDDNANIKTIPPGLRMLSGDSSKRSFDSTTMTYQNGQPIANRVSFNCLDSSGPIAQQPYMFRTDCSDGLRAQIQFQTCWDGKNVYLSDQSHMAYLSQIDNGVCPPTHPVLLPHLFFEVLYGVNDVKNQDGRFVFANGDATGYGFHGDFLNAWNATVLEAAIPRCLNEVASQGVISQCPVLAPYQDPYFATNCPQQPALIDEPVTGMLDKLPGCNNVTTGPAPGPQGVCPTQPKILPTPVYSQAPATATPTPGVVLGNWKYVGCASDSGNPRTLASDSQDSLKNMTTENCQTYCGSKGYGYAGTEYGQECWCSSTLAASNILSASACAATSMMRCTGSYTELCGGPNLLSVWVNKAFVPAPQPTAPVSGMSKIASNSAVYVGCYQESAQGHLLNSDTFTNLIGMTNELCADYCQKKDYALFGTEDASQCYCGTSSNNAISAPQSDCNTLCKGNNVTFCGGQARLSLWYNNNYKAPQIDRNPAPFKYQGCYVEATKGTILGNGPSGFYDDYKDPTNMTAEGCSSFCSGHGYEWMGLVNAAHCICNSDGVIKASGGGALVQDTQCVQPCSGNKYEFCGSNTNILVYKSTQSKGRKRWLSRHWAKVLPA